jgi:hypothetical protein
MEALAKRRFEERALRRSVGVERQRQQLRMELGFIELKVEAEPVVELGGGRPVPVPQDMLQGEIDQAALR